MAPPPGLEPGTYRLTAGCSTIELQGNVVYQPEADKSTLGGKKTPIESELVFDMKNARRLSEPIICIIVRVSMFHINILYQIRYQQSRGLTNPSFYAILPRQPPKKGGHYALDHAADRDRFVFLHQVGFLQAHSLGRQNGLERVRNRRTAARPLASNPRRHLHPLDRRQHDIWRPKRM